MTDRIVKVRFTVDEKGYLTGLTAMDTATSRFAKSAEDNLTAAKARGFDKMSTGAAGVGLVIGALAVTAVKKFADFDAAMSAAAAATGATGQELDDLRQLTIKMGADTQYSATEAADAITEMGKAGVSTADIYGGGLKGALNLAAAGQLDVGRAGEIAATAMTQFGLAGRDLPHVADLLSAAAGKAQGSVDDIANALKYAGPVAKGLGVSIEETTGVIAEFASQGIIGEQAGTSLRGVLLSLAAPTKIATDTMAKYGISLYDANGSFIGVSAAAEKLHTQLGPLDQATRTAALNQIFGNQQITAAQILYEGGAKSVDEWTSKVNDAGFAQEQAARLTDNLKGDVERLGGSLDTVFIQTGSGANDSLRSLVQGLEDVINKVGQVPGPALLAGGALVGLALAVPKGIQVYQRYTTTLDDVGLSLDKITAKAPRTGRALSAAATGAKAFGVGIAAAFAATAAAGDAFGVGVDKLGVEYLTKQLDGATDSVTSLNEAFASATNTGTLSPSNVKDLGTALHFAFAPEFLDNVANGLNGIYETFNGENTSDIAVAKTRISELDGALTNLAQSGNADKAADLFEKISNQALKQGINIDELKKQFPGYTEQLASAALAAGKTTTATGELTTATDETGAALDEAADSAKTFAEAVDTLNSPTLNLRDAQRAVKEAIIAANQSLIDNGKNLDDNKVKTDAARTAALNNQAALDAVAESMITVQTQMKNTGASEEALRGNLEQQRAKLYQVALQFFGNERAAHAYVDQVLKVPPTANTVVTANTAVASEKIKGVYDQLVYLNGKTASTYVTTFLKTVQTPGTGSVNVSSVGDLLGGNLPPAKKATGGAIIGPGTSTSDSVPILASTGEHMWTARETQAAGGHAAVAALRKAVLARSPRYASGGPIGITYSAASLSRTAAAAGAARAGLQFGDVNITAADPREAMREFNMEIATGMAAHSLGPL